MRLNEEQCRARFTEARVARLATVAQDGSPRLVPITFALVADAGDRDGDGDVIVTAVDQKPKSTTALARLSRIEREPRVSLLADVYSEDWSTLWWVSAEAHAEVLTSGTDWESAVALLQGKYEQYRRNPLSRAVIRMLVTRWSGWAAETGVRT